MGANESIFIYSTRQAETERVVQLLRTSLHRWINRTKKLAPLITPVQLKRVQCRKQKRIQLAFMTGSLRIVVATIVFGMGLNKSDVHAIIHYNVPKSFESYVQEIGRAAGRDRKPFCHVFIDRHVHV